MRGRNRRQTRRLGRLALPLLLLLCGWWLAHAHGPQAEPPPPVAEDPPFTLPAGGPIITVLLPDGECRPMAVEEFLVGVVAAEMPASFAMEALKAQAIAARTYVLAHSAPYGQSRHENADICADSTHCQAYAAPEKLRERWGGDFEQNYHAICQAVEGTAGLAVFYGAELVETPYCSTCGGRTQAARDVWGGDRPYLQSVECRWDGHSPRASATLVLSVEEAARALAVKPAAIRAMSASYTAGGAVAELTLAEKKLSGLELRQILGLDSAACQWLIEGGRILFSTRGFGHGVGLCQYGADGMAKEGFTAEDIITHYYQGVKVKTLY